MINNIIEQILKPVKIYFIVSWIVGILCLLNIFFFQNEILLCLYFLSFIGLLMNIVAIIFLIVLFLVFSENRYQFFLSIVLLLFNFPFVASLYIIINLILN